VATKDFVSGGLLELVKIKKLLMIPGRSLDKHTFTMASGGANDQVLKNFGTAENDGWL
jgi:hypothetical protein